MSSLNPMQRLKAYGRFALGALYFLLAQALADRGARGLLPQSLVSGEWGGLLSSAMLVFLLLVGYAAMGFALDRQAHPIRALGLPARLGWSAEFGLGLATGWGIALACVTLLALIGGIAIRLTLAPAAWGWLVVDLAIFALVTLAQEIAFRGYCLQRAMEAMGSFPAALLLAVLYAIVVGSQNGDGLDSANHTSLFVNLALGLVLTTAYLRTRALWLGWGLHFGWVATRALLFGLPVAGINTSSPVVEGNPMGPFWLTGGGFGLDGSWVAAIALLLALALVYRVTRDLDFRYNAPVLTPGGVPVDLDAAARRQHEAATQAVVLSSQSPAGLSTAGQSLVQILPVPSIPRPVEMASSPLPPNLRGSANPASADPASADPARSRSETTSGR